MKKWLLLVLTIILCLLFIAGSFAFLTKEKKEQDIITFGNLKMKIIETKLNVNDKEIIVKDGESLDISYSPNIKRILRLKNLGKQEIFVRLNFNIVGIDEKNNFYNVDDMYEITPEIKDWIYKDGWYYYKYKLKKDEITNKLIANINFNIKDMMRKYPNGSFDLKINAQAVQAKNNEKQILNVKGWPANN